MKTAPEMPERLKGRPRYGEYVIPYSVVVIDGVPDFRVTNMEHWFECIRRKLCAICGQPLEYWVWYLGGPSCVEGDVYFDLGMHEECCFYSAAVCPFLAGEKDYSKRPYQLPGGEITKQGSRRGDALIATKRRRDQLKVIPWENGGRAVLVGPAIEQVQVWPKETE